MAFDFPADCRTAAERAAWCLACKRELIAAHNAAKDAAGRESAALKLRIVCGALAVLRSELGHDRAEADAARAAVELQAKTLAVQPAALASIDYAADRAKVKDAVPKAVVRGG